MDRLTVTRRAWIGIALLTALVVVFIFQARAHSSGSHRPAQTIYR
jgi:hypothetical protein